MIYSVNFMDMTEKLNPLAVCRYLNNTGWVEFPTKKTFLKVFQYYIQDDFYQVTIPIDKRLGDYKQAMYKAVDTISSKEQRSLKEVMLYLLNPNTDILKIRLDKIDIDSGNITFDDAMNIYQNAKKLLSATASDIIHPNKYHQGRIDNSINKFLSKCSFGQTEIGSYVVPIVCPFAELDENSNYQQLSIFSEEERCENSFTRKVTNRLINNIYIVKDCIDNNQTEKLVDNDSSSYIISANFLEALNGMSLNSENVGVEFIAEWCPSVKNVDCITNRVLLTHDYYQPIETVIQRLKEEVNKATKIIGRIKKLESSPDAEKRTTGKITIIYLDENNQSKTATTKLAKNDYDLAIEAHVKGKHVEVIGEFVKKSEIDCQSFSVID